MSSFSPREEYEHASVSDANEIQISRGTAEPWSGAQGAERVTFAQTRHFDSTDTFTKRGPITRHLIITLSQVAISQTGQFPYWLLKIYKMRFKTYTAVRRFSGPQNITLLVDNSSLCVVDILYEICVVDMLYILYEIPGRELQNHSSQDNVWKKTKNILKNRIK